jgi:hypothetical protein
MNKIISLLLVSSVFAVGIDKYNGSTNASVSLAAGIIKAQNTQVDKKYKRKDCPVCEGKGYYISGDKITKVNCGYCEADKAGSVTSNPTIIYKQNCPNGICPTPSTGSKNGR